MKKNCNIVLGVTGGIACYKSVDIVSRLKKLGFNIDVIMTKSAQEFVKPLTFQSISSNRVVTDMFDTNYHYDIEHISLAKKADAILVAPATANIIAKVANGIADDMLSTVILASKAKIIMAPAMNTVMYESEITQENIQKLKKRGVIFIEPLEGLLACNDVGKGKMQEPAEIVRQLLFYINKTDDLKDKKILITAGGTRENIDPVRYITNRSTGKMGYALAEVAALRGAEVTLISAKTNLEVPFGISKFVSVETSLDMYNAVVDNFDDNDVIIKSAAVSDYKPKEFSDKKIKKSDGEMYIELDRTKDILFEISKKKKENQIFIGFAAETNDILENAESKLNRKKLDFIVANDVKAEGAGFSYDTNIVTIISKEGNIEKLPLMSKKEVAEKILDLLNK